MIDLNENQRATLRTVALCVVALVGMSALCATLFFKNYADPPVLIAIISTTGTAVGALMNSRPQQPTETSSTNRTTT